MKIKVEKEVEIEILEVSAGVRYWDDATVGGVEDANGDLIPCRVGDRWKPQIRLSDGKILNWKEGVKAEIHYKVCDDGFYSLLNASGEAVKTKGGYVPEIMSPKENGYGDYIIMDVDEKGIIQNWKPDLGDDFD